VRRAALILSAVALLAGTGSDAASLRSIRVRNPAEFAAAVGALSGTGGTIYLARGVYADLSVSGWYGPPLGIVGARGTRVGRLTLDHAQHVSVGQIILSPVGGDARLEVVGSSQIDLHELLVTAQRTLFSATVDIPDSTGVTIRNSTFTHCGDRVGAWVNCLLLDRYAHRITIEHDWFHDCLGCDFVHGRWGSGLTIRQNRFERAVPCHLDAFLYRRARAAVGKYASVRCHHQDLIELFGGSRLRIARNHFGVQKLGGAQVYLTGPGSGATVVNNVFLATDPRVPGWKDRVGLLVGGNGGGPVPHFVRVLNNTILSGDRRMDGYLGSISISGAYAWRVPRAARPVIANNVLGILKTWGPVCNGARSVSNVVLDGHACSRSDQVGPAELTGSGRPTAGSDLLIGKANRSYAPTFDITGKRRPGAPTIGAYEYRR
jgi:hypothetical protein